MTHFVSPIMLKRHTVGLNTSSLSIGPNLKNLYLYIEKVCQQMILRRHIAINKPVRMPLEATNAS
jgi:hypothetical protein